jgi:Stabilization of polarity axis
MKVCLPSIPTGIEDFSNTISLKKFIMKFGEKTMLIYDALLSEKRILFSGSLEHSASEIADYVLACSHLVAPPLLGISGRLYPYAALDNLGFLEEPGFVAGVTNPMFKQKQAWHDVCCEVDLGKIKVSKNKDFYNYEQEKYFNIDMEFIRALIVRVKHNDCSDEDIRRAFESYTLMTLDLALMYDDQTQVAIIHDQDKLSDILSSRVKRF